MLKRYIDEMDYMINFPYIYLPVVKEIQAAYITGIFTFAAATLTVYIGLKTLKSQLQADREKRVDDAKALEKNKQFDLAIELKKNLYLKATSALVKISTVTMKFAELRTPLEDSLAEISKAQEVRHWELR